MNEQIRKKIEEHYEAVTFVAFGFYFFGPVLWTVLLTIGSLLVARSKDERARYLIGEVRAATAILKEVPPEKIADILGK